MNVVQVVFAVLAAFGGTSGQRVCSKGDTETCVCDAMDNSGIIDLNVLGDASNLPWFWEIESSNKPALFFYSYSPCYAFTDCNGIPGLAMSQWPGDSADACFGIGVMNTSRFVQDENGAISLHYHSSDKKRTAIVHLECNMTSNTTELIQYGDDYYKYHFNFRLNGPAACSIAKKHNLSTKLVILLVVVSFLIAYLTAGVTYKIYKKKRSRQAQAHMAAEEDGEVEDDLLDDKNTNWTRPVANYGSTDEDSNPIRIQTEVEDTVGASNEECRYGLLSDEHSAESGCVFAEEEANPLNHTQPMT